MIDEGRQVVAWPRGSTGRRGEIAPLPAGGAPLERELVVAASHEVELKFGGKTVSLVDRPGVEALPRKPGIYLILVDGTPWYVGKGANIRARFQERLKAFADFRIPPERYLPLLRPVTVRWYELVRFTAPKGSSFKARGRETGGSWRKVSTSQGLLRALEQHFISKYGTNLLGNKTTECVRTEGTITVVYDFGASRTPRERVPSRIFC